MAISGYNSLVPRGLVPGRRIYGCSFALFYKLVKLREVHLKINGTIDKLHTFLLTACYFKDL